MKKVLFCLSAIVFSIGLLSGQNITPDPVTKIIYVNANQTTGNYNGSSWSNATKSLGDAMQRARQLNDNNPANPGVKEIWVAAGTLAAPAVYKPNYNAADVSTGNSHNLAFVLPKNVKIYGGFEPGETDRARRDTVNLSRTVLSGELLPGNDNVYQVVIATGDLVDTHLSGFTISDGYARGVYMQSIKVNGTDVYTTRGAGIYLGACTGVYLENLVIKNNRSDWYGGGILISAFTETRNADVSIRDAVIEDNISQHGGGLYVLSGLEKTANLNMRNTVIQQNTASGSGGGLYVSNKSTFTINNLDINSNTAAANGGGACLGGAVIGNCSFTNMLVHSNTANGEGGGLYVNTGIYIFNNITIAQNRSIGKTHGSGIHITNGGSGFTGTIRNSIVWGNGSTTTLADNINLGQDAASLSFMSSLVQGAEIRNGITHNTDPLFVNPLARIGKLFMLQSESPAVNAGNNSLYTTGLSSLSNDVDLAGNPRLYGSTIDMGAYETQEAVGPTPDFSGILYVNKNKNGDGSSWESALTELADALKLAKQINATAGSDKITEIWVADGTYTPMYNAIDNTTGNGGRNNAFVLPEDVKLYGGFPTNANSTQHTSIAVRDTINRNTILDGRLLDASSQLVNAYHVLIAAGDLGSASLNGFTIKNGLANDVNSSMQVNNQLIENKNGAGLYISFSALSLFNLTICNNNSSNLGGGLFVTGSASSRLVNGIIYGNQAYYGGAISTNLTATNLLFVTNTLIHNNSASVGGAFHVSNSSGGSLVLVTNSTIEDNSATIFGNIYAQVGSLVMQNSIAWRNSYQYGGNIGGNVTHYNNLIGGVALGNGIIANSDPIFVDADNADIAARDYRITAGSPALDAGENSYYLNVPGMSPDDKDLYGNNRFDDDIDLGAYEYVKISAEPAGIIYVNKLKDGNGHSWEAAMKELSDALKKASEINNNPSTPPAGKIKEIWVADGVYTPLYTKVNSVFTNLANYNAFTLEKDVKLYGGFPAYANSTEHTNINQRDTISRNTVLSGEFYNATKQMNDKVYHLVIAAGDLGTAELNGFTITGGAADGRATVIVNGISIYSQYGGGIYNSGASIAFKNLTVKRNTALSEGDEDGGNGGGILINNSSSVFENIILYGNEANYTGGAICIKATTSSSPSFTNLLVYGNRAFYGAGIYAHINDNDEVSVCNATISDNYSTNYPYGVELFMVGNFTFRINNSIIWNSLSSYEDNVFGEPVFASCLIQNGDLNTPGIILNTDPLFVDNSSSELSVRDYHLSPASPAIDKGNNSLFPLLDSAIDLYGNRRKSGENIDLGAFEYQHNTWKGLFNTNWDVASNWENNEVLESGGRLLFAPDAANDLVIASSEYVVGALQNTSGKQLRIKDGGALTVEGNDIVLQDAQSLCIETGGSGTINGSFIFPQSVDVHATVEFTTKASTTTGEKNATKFNWQYFGSPIDEYNVSTLHGAFIRQHNENPNEGKYWSSLTNSSSMSAFRGYEISKYDNHSGKFVFRGKLVNQNKKNLALSRSGTAASNTYIGQHLLANPYMAALPITTEMFGTGMEQTIYLFNTGSREQWESTGDAGAPGQYTAIPARLAGAMGMEYIPSMQGFVVKANTDGAVFNFDYDSVEKNTVAMRSKKQAKDIAFSKITLLKGDTNLTSSPTLANQARNITERFREADHVWLFTDSEFTPGFDNGYDGYKLVSSNNPAQLYSVENNVAYQVKAVPNINNTILFFKAEENVGNYTLKFSHSNMVSEQSVYLFDLQENMNIDITSDGSVYHFTATNSSYAQPRFLITTEQAGGTTNKLIEINQFEDNILIKNHCDQFGAVSIYSLSGQLVHQNKIQALSSLLIRGNDLRQGIYIVKVNVENQETFSEKIILK